MRRPRSQLVLGLLLLAVALLAAACSAGATPPTPTSTSSTTTSSSTTSTTASASTTTTSTTTTSTIVPTSTTNPAGNLPQTDVFPSSSSRQFQDEMAALWQAIVTGNAMYAQSAFFPVNAYEKVKAIADPASDWQYRLWGGFVLDVTAAHDYLGSAAKTAKFLGVEVTPASEDNWVLPGGCYNALPYWHAPGNRLLYEVGGVEHSIGIVSLISWRGQWYVVHFGAIVHSGYSGVVDSPQIGPGSLGPAGGC